MAKKSKSLLELSPISVDAGLASSNNQNALDEINIFSSNSRLIGNEAQKQKSAIDALTKKALYGMDRIAEIDRQAGDVFEETARRIMTTKREVQGQDHQKHIEEFSHRLVQMSARHMLGVVEIGATGIALEVHRSPYPPEPERQSLIKRLLG